MKTAIAMREDKMAIEYIDREKAKRLLHIEYAYAAEQLLDEVPAADVAPVVHGWWIDQEGILVCSNCEAEIETNNSFGESNHRNFCPNCGAKMDGGGNDAID